MPNATPQQTSAIETLDRALVVDAGAGTGKTWVLVSRYLHQLDQHPEWPIDSIIAITFTEKAAREMRNRIRAAVEQQAKESDARSPWQARRRSLDQIQVSTIHSLCARILRANAIAAGIDPGFEVMEEDDSKLLVEEAVRQTLNVLANDEDHPALPLFGGLSVLDIKTTMADLLGKRGTIQRLFDDLKAKEALLELWETSLTEMLVQIWRRAVNTDPDLAAALNDLPEVDIVDPADKLASAVRLAQEGCALIEQGDIRSAIGCFARINRSGGKAANWGGSEEKKQLSSMLKALQVPSKEWEQSGITTPIGPLDEDAADNLLAWRALWETLTQIYDRLKEERAGLDFDDLERQTVRLLRQTPVSDRLQAYLDSINHVMVDEFQDTNLIQQEIVYQLASPEIPGRLFVVGDAKQSIYRFRQAQVSIFNQTAQIVKQVTGHAPQLLNQSFRTHQELVDGINALFDHLLQPLDGEGYQPFEAKPGALSAVRAMATESPPPIELWLLPGKDADGENIAADDGRLWEAQLLADRLLALHQEGCPIWDKEENTYRPFRFKDAAILFRSTTSLPLYEEVFKQKSLPYLTVSGRGYYDRPEVRNLIALLAVLHNPGDDFNLAVVLRSALFGLSDETLYRLRWRDAGGSRPNSPRPLRLALAEPPATDQARAIVHAHAVLSELWAEAGRVDVWLLLRLALDRTAYETTLVLRDQAGEGGGRQLSNVHKFLGLAREKGGSNLSDFLRRMTDLRATEAREGEALGREPESGAVQLMSIHASKGLEFPVVAVADLGRSPMSSSDYILHDPEIGLVCKVRDENGDWQSPPSYVWGKWQVEQMDEAENRRLLYVACTRAADRLILSGKLSSGKQKGWLAQILAAWSIELDGDKETLLHREPSENSGSRFRIGVYRPTEQPDALRSTAKETQSHAGLTQLPALSRPLDGRQHQDAVTVTHFLRGNGRASSEDEDLPILRPAVRPTQAEQRMHPVPRYLLGNIVHRALDDWDLLSLPSSDIHRGLFGIARSLGVGNVCSAEDAARKAARQIGNLKATPLYEQIQHADRRLQEVPFTLTTNQGILHGTIDLLFEDRSGWHLIDWKSEWVAREDVDVKGLEFLPQLSVYHLAARQILGIRPRTGVCLLSAQAALRWFTDDELAQSLTDLGIQPMLT